MFPLQPCMLGKLTVHNRLHENSVWLPLHLVGVPIADRGVNWILPTQADYGRSR